MIDISKKEKLYYATCRLHQVATDLSQLQKLFRENGIGIQDELIGKAVDLLIRCDDLNHVDQDLDKYALIDGMTTHQISSQL